MRRQRYKGKYPKRPEEKYKELHPENYPKDMAHIQSKGRTPLGTHKPIMVQEILDALNPRPGQLALDLTLGFGGHALEILKRIHPHGFLLGLDQDPIELPKTVARLQSQGYGPNCLKGLHTNFRHLLTIKNDSNSMKDPFSSGFDLVLADLGLSSMQIDQTERGFSSKYSSGLDFRMDPTRGKSAYDLLHEIQQKDLEEILQDYADEPFPYKMALGLLTAVKSGEMKTTQDLKKAIIYTVSQIKKYPTDPEKAVTRVFQALRIFVNDELQALDELLETLPQFLKPGSRIAFLTFHSGEDRRVKKFFKNGLLNHLMSEIHGPLRASAEEVAMNRRSRSAKLRWGIWGAT